MSRLAGAWTKEEETSKKMDRQCGEERVVEGTGRRVQDWRKC